MESTRGELLQIIHKTGTYGVKAVRALLPRICHSELRAEVEKHGVWYQTAAKKPNTYSIAGGFAPGSQWGAKNDPVVLAENEHDQKFDPIESGGNDGIRMHHGAH